MNRARTWVLTVAISWFVLGVAVGLVVPGFFEEPPPAWDADEYFVQDLVDGLDLSPEQEDTLRMVMAARSREEIAHIKSFGFENLPSPLQRSLDQAGDLADRRVQVILNEAQRKRFQELLDKLEKG